MLWSTYIFAGTPSSTSTSAESSGGSRRFSKSKVLLSAVHDQTLSPGDNNKKGYLSSFYDNSLCLSPRGNGGVHNAEKVCHYFISRGVARTFLFSFNCNLWEYSWVFQVPITSILEIYYPSLEGLSSWLLIVITAMHSRQVCQNLFLLDGLFFTKFLLPVLVIILVCIAHKSETGNQVSI